MLTVENKKNFSTSQWAWSGWHPQYYCTWNGMCVCICSVNEHQMPTSGPVHAWECEKTECIHVCTCGKTMCVCVCVCVCVYIYIYIHTHTQPHLCVQFYAHTRTAFNVLWIGIMNVSEWTQNCAYVYTCIVQPTQSMCESYCVCQCVHLFIPGCVYMI